MNKSLWISLLEAAGHDQTARLRWHREFERASPIQHLSFLRFLCLSEAEIEALRARCRGAELPSSR